MSRVQVPSLTQRRKAPAVRSGPFACAGRSHLRGALCDGRGEPPPAPTTEPRGEAAPNGPGDNQSPSVSRAKPTAGLSRFDPRGASLFVETDPFRRSAAGAVATRLHEARRVRVHGLHPATDLRHPSEQGRRGRPARAHRCSRVTQAASSAPTPAHTDELCIPHCSWKLYVGMHMRQEKILESGVT